MPLRFFLSPGGRSATAAVDLGGASWDSVESFFFEVLFEDLCCVKMILEQMTEYMKTKTEIFYTLYHEIIIIICYQLVSYVNHKHPLMDKNYLQSC